MSYAIISFIKRALQGGTGGAVPVADDQPLPVYNAGGAPEDADGVPVAASQANYALQTSVGAAGDYLSVLMIIPANTSPGAVTFKDGSGASVTAFHGGANSVATLAPLPFVVNKRSADGAWSVTTGAGVSVWASGEFS